MVGTVVWIWQYTQIWKHVGLVRLCLVGMVHTDGADIWFALRGGGCAYLLLCVFFCIVIVVAQCANVAHQRAFVIFVAFVLAVIYGIELAL